MKGEHSKKVFLIIGPMVEQSAHNPCFRVQIQLYQMEKIVKKAAVSIAEAVGPKFIKFFRFVE